MLHDLDFWKHAVLERQEKGQSINEWCQEHNVTSGAYKYWSHKILANREGMSRKETSVAFAKVVSTGKHFVSGLTITWQDVTIQLSTSNEAQLAAEMIACLRRSC
jgi:hypothetical protein